MTIEPLPTHPPLAPAVSAAIADYPDGVRARILELRSLVWEVANGTDSVGDLEETLKWGQPSYITTNPRSGTTVRIDRVKGTDDVAVFTHCQTPLVSECREENGDLFDYDGTRAVIIQSGRAIPQPQLSDHLRSALTYHLR